MDPQSEVPEKRFESYQQVFDSEGVAIGFTLPQSDFLFKYDQDGGWKDEKGNYYNSKGVLQKIADGISDDDEEDINDDEELDQFQRMLDDDSLGQKKPKEQVIKKKYAKKQSSEDYKSQTSKLLQNYKNKVNIREGLPEQLHIFFKMRSKFYQRIQPKIEKTQSVIQLNEEVKKIKVDLDQRSKKIKQSNKWIDEKTQLQFSGTQLDEATYDRYWYGTIKTTAQKYCEIAQQVEKSEQFAFLDHKSFFALKSKFYLKKKMQQTIKQLMKKLEGLEENAIVKITADNLPENFPVSFIFDLCSFSGTPIQQIHSVQIIDDFKAEIFISKLGALKFLNVEGYCHDEKQYVELEVELEKQTRLIQKSGMFKIKVHSSKKNPYKTHVCELQDTLAITKSRDGQVKLFTVEEERQNGGFRFVVAEAQLKKVLMFRGASLDVLHIELFEKKPSA